MIVFKIPPRDDIINSSFFGGTAIKRIRRKLPDPEERPARADLTDGDGQPKIPSHKVN
jgi:hypothetical protein